MDFQTIYAIHEVFVSCVCVCVCVCVWCSCTPRHESPLHMPVVSSPSVRSRPSSTTHWVLLPQRINNTAPKQTINEHTQKQKTNNWVLTRVHEGNNNNNLTVISTCRVKKGNTTSITTTITTSITSTLTLIVTIYTYRK